MLLVPRSREPLAVERADVRRRPCELSNAVTRLPDGLKNGLILPVQPNASKPQSESKRGVHPKEYAWVGRQRHQRRLSIGFDAMQLGPSPDP